MNGIIYDVKSSNLSRLLGRSENTNVMNQLHYSKNYPKYKKSTFSTTRSGHHKKRYINAFKRRFKIFFRGVLLRIRRIPSWISMLFKNCTFPVIDNYQRNINFLIKFVMGTRRVVVQKTVNAEKQVRSFFMSEDDEAGKQLELFPLNPKRKDKKNTRQAPARAASAFLHKRILRR